MSDTQEHLDRYYFDHGPCCAGCDWWRPFNGRVGECTKSAPMRDVERWAMLGIEGLSLRPGGAGHVATNCNHVCGDFKDEFDWSSLPLAYRKSVGDPSIKR